MWLVAPESAYHETSACDVCVREEEGLASCPSKALTATISSSPPFPFPDADAVVDADGAVVVVGAS